MKIQSETPRTELFWQNDEYEKLRHDHKICAWSDFVRQLERDLACANQRISFLESAEIGQVESDNKALKRQLAEFVRTEPLKVDELVKLRKQLAEVKQQLDKGCQCACHNEPLHSKLQDVAEANQFHIAQLNALRSQFTAKTAEVERLQGVMERMRCCGNCADEDNRAYCKCVKGENGDLYKETAWQLAKES